MARHMATSLIGRAAIEVGADTSKFEKDVKAEAVPAAEKAGEAAGEGFSSALEGALKLAGVASAGAAIGAAFLGAINVEGVNDKLSAQLGLTEAESERIGGIAGSLYTNAYGDSLAGVSDAVAAVMTSITGASELPSAELEAITATALDFASAFEVDVSRAAQVAGQAVRTGLADNATEAFDLLTAASQKVPAALREDILDAADEYGPFFAQLGISGEAAFGALVAGAEQGMYGIDKTGDALKEFTIRATDMSTTSVGAFEAIGLDAQTMANDILSGGDAAAGAMDQIVSGLLGIEDPAEQANAAIALFGTPLEDLGVGAIPDFLSALSGGETGMSDFAGAAERMGETLNDNVGTRFEGLKRQMSDFGIELAERALPAIESVFGFISENQGAVAGMAVAVGGLLAVHTAWNAVMAVQAAGGIAAWVAQTNIAKAATALWTGAQWLLNAALNANPIGIVIAIIAGLVAALVIAYKKSETFRDIVNGAWSAIKDGIGAVVSWLTDTAWPFVKGVFDKIGAAVKFLYENFIRPQWVLMKLIIESVVDWLRNTAWPFIKDVWDKIAAGATWLYENAIKPAWDKIKAGIEVVVGWLRDTAWPIIKDAWDKIAAGAKKMWEDWIKPAFDRFKDGLGVIADAVGKTKDAIASVWEKITSAISGPLDKAKDWINRNFISPVNSLFEKLGMTIRIPSFGGGGQVGVASSGGPASAFAAGGRVPGYSPTPTSDNIPAWLTAGEYVLPVNATKRLMGQVGAGGLEMLRRGMIPGFALGGMVDWVKKKGTDAIDFASSIGRVLMDPKKALEEFASSALRGLGDQPFVQALGAATRKIIGTLVSKITDWLGADVSGAPGGAMGWQQIWALIKAVAPEAQMTSNYRPGARTASGYQSLHGLGRAVDLISGNMMATFNKIRPLRAWSELYYSPAEGRQLLRGRPHTPQGITRAMHYDHIHAAMAHGGLVKPFVADAGVRLAPGLNLLDNRIGKPEPLGRMDQMPTTITARLDASDLEHLARVIGMQVREGARLGATDISRAVGTH